MALKGYKITSLTVFFYNAHIITKSYDSVKPVEEEQLELLATDGMLVKRPLFVTQDYACPG